MRAEKAEDDFRPHKRKKEGIIEKHRKDQVTVTLPSSKATQKSNTEKHLSTIAGRKGQSPLAKGQ